MDPTNRPMQLDPDSAGIPLPESPTVVNSAQLAAACAQIGASFTQFAEQLRANAQQVGEILRLHAPSEPETAEPAPPAGADTPAPHDAPQEATA